MSRDFPAGTRIQPKATQLFIEYLSDAQFQPEAPSITQYW